MKFYEYFLDELIKLSLTSKKPGQNCWPFDGNPNISPLPSPGSPHHLEVCEGSAEAKDHKLIMFSSRTISEPNAGKSRELAKPPQRLCGEAGQPQTARWYYAVLSVSFPSEFLYPFIPQIIIEKLL